MIKIKYIVVLSYVFIILIEIIFEGFFRFGELGYDIKKVFYKIFCF